MTRRTRQRGEPPHLALKYTADTSVGPLELEVTELSGEMLVRIPSTNETWNSTYTPVSLTSFLAEFAGVPEAEAVQISKQLTAAWESREGSSPSLQSEAPKVLLSAMPVAALVLLMLFAFGVLAFVFLRLVLFS